MEQMRKGSDLYRGFRLGRPESGKLPFYTQRDPGNIPEQKEESGPGPASRRPARAVTQKRFGQH